MNMNDNGEKRIVKVEEITEHESLVYCTAVVPRECSILCAYPAVIAHNGANSNKLRGMRVGTRAPHRPLPRGSTSNRWSRTRLARPCEPVS